MKKKIQVKNKMQSGYVYELVAPTGRTFDKRFKPDLSPKEMLDLGIFGGVYMRDCKDEYPKSWFEKAKLAEDKRDKDLNYFKINASQPLSVWRKNGWIYKDDPRGWFEWYCRYYMGRRIPDEDDRQIKRWVAMNRHVSQLRKNCRIGDLSCRPRQRQALLHWAYDTRKL